MNRGVIDDLVDQIYRRLHDKAPDPQVAATLHHIVRNNGLGQGCPHWLQEMLEAIANDGDFAARHLSVEESGQRTCNYDSFFVEFSEVADFQHTLEGEYLWLSFHPLGVSVLFNYETAEGGVDIEFTRSPTSLTQRSIREDAADA